MKTNKRIFIKEKNYEHLMGELIDIVVIDGEITFIYSNITGKFDTVKMKDAIRIENPYRKKKKKK